MEIRINPPAYLLQITALPHTTRECTKLHPRLTHTYLSCHSIDHYWLLERGPESLPVLCCHIRMTSHVKMAVCGTSRVSVNTSCVIAMPH